MIQSNDIFKFLEKLKFNYGYLPKSAYNSSEFNGQVCYSGPYWDDCELTAAIRNLLSGKWMVYGEECRSFERKFSEMFEPGSDSVFVNSGSSADLLMLAALKKRFNWQDDDEIILSNVGFPTTLNSVVQNNLSPQLADIEMSTLNFDLDHVVRLITPRTRGIILSPVLGNPCDIDKLASICKIHNLIFILDNCDSLGSKWRSKLLNEYAYVSSCSFFPAHHISTMQGGMVTSKDFELTKIVRSLSQWGRSCYCVGVANLSKDGCCGKRFSRWFADQDIILDHKYIYDNIGYNLQPLDLQGSIGIEQLKKFDIIDSLRKKHFRLIENLLTSSIKNIKIAEVLSQSDPCWFGIPIICEGKDQKRKLVAHFENNGIQTRNYFCGNILLHPAYRYLGNWKDYPNATQVLARVFFLGCSPTYTNKHLEHIHNIIRLYAP